MIVYIYLIESPKIYELTTSVKTKADNYLINVFLYKFRISPKILNLTKVKMLKSQLRTKNKVLLYKESDFFTELLSFHINMKKSLHLFSCFILNKVDLVRLTLLKYLSRTAFIVVYVFSLLFCRGVKIYFAHKIC